MTQTERAGDTRWETWVRQRAADLAYRYPSRVPEIIEEMLERLEHGREGEQ